MRQSPGHVSRDTPCAPQVGSTRPTPRQGARSPPGPAPAATRSPRARTRRCGRSQVRDREC